MCDGRLSLHLLRRVVLLKYSLLELEVLLLDPSLLQRHWLLTILLSRYSTILKCPRSAFCFFGIAIPNLIIFIA